MPNIRSLDGGLTFVYAGTVAEETKIQTQTVQRLVVQEHAGAADDADAHVQIDPNNVDGPLVVRYNLGQGQKGLTIENKANGVDVFNIDANGDTNVMGDLIVLQRDTILGDLLGTGNATFQADLVTKHLSVTTVTSGDLFTVDEDDGVLIPANVEVTGAAAFLGELVASGTVSGDVFVSNESHTQDYPKDTVVTRNHTTGTARVANLRVLARRTQLDGNLLCPDGLPAGLFAPNATVTEVLELVENGRVVKENRFGDNGEFYRLYRFGSHPTASHEAHDGLYMVNSKTNDQISLVMYENNTKMLVTGSVENDKPLVLFQSSDSANIGLQVIGRTLVEELQTKGDIQIDGNVFCSDGNVSGKLTCFDCEIEHANVTGKLDVTKVEATTHVYSPYLRVMGQGIGGAQKLIQAVAVNPGAPGHPETTASIFSVHADGACNIAGVANTHGLTTHNVEISMSDQLPLDTAGLQLVSVDQQGNSTVSFLVDRVGNMDISGSVDRWQSYGTPCNRHCLWRQFSLHWFVAAVVRPAKPCYHLAPAKVEPRAHVPTRPRLYGKRHLVWR